MNFPTITNSERAGWSTRPADISSSTRAIAENTMADLKEDLLFIVMQYLNEEKYKETVHHHLTLSWHAWRPRLERDSGIFLNQKYVEDLVMAGKFDQVEHYLLGFTKIDENMQSVKLFFEIRMQKYIEALKRNDRFKAVDILYNDLKQFQDYNPQLYKDITQLLTVDDLSEVTTHHRALKWLSIKKLIEDNPVIRPKLTFPVIPTSRLKTLMNHSLHSQHHACKNPLPNVDIKTLYTDHICEPLIGLQTTLPPNNPPTRIIQNGMDFLSIATHTPFQPGFNDTSTTTRWSLNLDHHLPHDAVTNAGAMPLSQPSSSRKKHQLVDSERVVKRFKTSHHGEVTGVGPTHFSNIYLEIDPPKTIVRNLNQGSNVVSLDFHPRQQTILLVGTDGGDIEIWEVGSSRKLNHRSFKYWDASYCIMEEKEVLLKESTLSVNKCIWSPSGTLVGVAFSKNIVQIYFYTVTGQLRQQLQINAHIGGVNDIVFLRLQKELCVVTCGDDMTIKVWHTETGYKKYTFEGHTTPVYSICANNKENIQYILSTSLDGKIKAWLFHQTGSQIDYDAPGDGHITMAYSDDRSRLFSCGTNKDGESYLLEWNESDGSIKRMYSGIQSKSLEPLKFDTTKNRVLAAGDEYQIKFWEMDNVTVFLATSVEGCLPCRPHLCFNKEGSLLAVTTNNNGVKILANKDGLRFLRKPKNRGGSLESVMTKGPHRNAISVEKGISPVPISSEKSKKNLQEILLNRVDSSQMVDVAQRLPDEGVDKRKSWKLFEVKDPAQCRSIILLDPVSNAQASFPFLCTRLNIVRLHYTYSGSSLLALDANATFKLWKWQHNDLNPFGEATTNCQPQLWQPPDGLLMKNDTSDRGPQAVFPCIALSDNNAYLMSASGGQVSLFKMKTFEVIEKCMAPPPAATFIAFNPLDNNIVAIGMEDSTIQIFNVPENKVTSELKGHQKRITGLVFSEHLNVLISCGADAQLCVWGINGWERQKSKFVHTKTGKSLSPLANTRIQFHNDRVHLLVVQENQIAIYNAPELECVRYWAPQDPLLARISSATYSSDNLLIYVSFYDGSIGVFDAEVLRPRCRISPSAFIPSMSSGNIYPLVIAANPLKPNQFAVGLTDGGVHVIEPTESEGKWDVALLENGGAPWNHTIKNQGSE
eukprot:PITA_01046